MSVYILNFNEKQFKCLKKMILCTTLYPYNYLGIGYGQIYAIAITTSYYASVLTLIIKYFVASFGSGLPWSYCRLEWGPNCIDSAKKSFPANATSQNGTSSAELYF